MSCTSYDAANAYIFLNMILFTKEKIIFPDILRQGKCYSARWLLKEICFGSGSVYHLIDRHESNTECFSVLAA